MLFLYTVLVVCCGFLLVAGIIEQRRHFTNLERIPSRVLVNGIRGKSSITRLCAGALRGGGLTTVAKTTGTAARFIHPDATEEPVYRKFGIANVVEQIGIVRRAAAYSPDALVIECMAVMPALQEINQSKLIRSTIGVLCNVREDHLAEMGPTLDDVARSLSRSMPEGGICITAEKDRFHILQEEADARDCRLMYADPEIVSDEELRGFSWFTFKENVAIALTVAELLGVERETALRGMYDAPPDPGVLSVERYRSEDGKRLRFANVFAANDPESTLMNINQLLDVGAIKRPLNVVINCRPDRVERNGQMGAIVPGLRPDKVFVIGHPAKSAIDAIPADWRHCAVDLGGDRRDPAEFMARMLAELGPDSSLVAIGNIHGQGELLLEQLAELPADETLDETPDAALGGMPPGGPQGTRHVQAPAAADTTNATGTTAGGADRGPRAPGRTPAPVPAQRTPVRHDETLALQQLTPRIDPYQPYSETYETRYQPQQPPRAALPPGAGPGPQSATPTGPQSGRHSAPQSARHTDPHVGPHAAPQPARHTDPHPGPHTDPQPGPYPGPQEQQLSPWPQIPQQPTGNDTPSGPTGPPPPRGMFEPVNPPAPAQQQNPGEPR